jgi:hypothetical protein
MFVDQVHICVLVNHTSTQGLARITRKKHYSLERMEDNTSLDPDAQLLEIFVVLDDSFD